MLPKVVKTKVVLMRFYASAYTFRKLKKSNKKKSKEEIELQLGPAENTG
jgi:hypothetical protein